MIVTIDGPAGTGKSSVARRLAKRLGLEFLDTGAMYRAAALLAIERSLPSRDGGAIAAAVREQGLSFDWSKDPPTLLLGLRSVMARIRDKDVNDIVSDVATQHDVREVMVELQVRISRQHRKLVTEGRDQGSTVFPDAEVRFYLDADPEERARRRCDQLRGEGRPADPKEVLQSILERDRIDSTRADAPLRIPEGAVIVDTSELLECQVVDCLEAEVRRRVPPELLKAPAAGDCVR